jgi:hypothetical protein
LWLLLSSLALGAPLLDAEGGCPGAVTVTVSGLTPGAVAGVAHALDEGASPVAGGVCAGTFLGLHGDSLRLLRKVTSGPDGSASFVVSVDWPRCGTPIQAVDTATCAASEVAPLGAALVDVVVDLSHAGTDSGPSLDLGDLVLSASRDGAPEDVVLTDLNGAGVRGGPWDMNVDDGEALHVAFAEHGYGVVLELSMMNDLSGDGVLGALEVEAFDDAGSSLGTLPWSDDPHVDVDLLFGSPVSAVRLTAMGDSHRVARVRTLVEAP